MHISLLAPHMTPLNHARNECNSTTTTGWTNRQSTTQSVVAGALFRQCALILIDYTETASVAYPPGDNNVLSDTASCQWDLSDTVLLFFSTCTSHSGTHGDSVWSHQT